MRGQHFGSDDDVKTAVKCWLEDQPEDFPRSLSVGGESRKVAHLWEEKVEKYIKALLPKEING